MSNSQRPGLKSRTMAPPTRRPFNRAQTATPSLTGRASPADSLTSATHGASRLRSPALQVPSLKRKEREYDPSVDEGANINVVVRCRGRNDREVRENSGVVVTTDGLRGKSVELSMGPSALSNKTYTFDHVFSPAADQIMIFDEVVTPILDEVGFKNGLLHSEKLTIIGPFRLQLYNFRIRPNGNWQDLHHVW